MDYKQINQFIAKTCEALVQAIAAEAWPEVDLLSGILEKLMAIRDRHYMSAPMQTLNAMRQSLEDMPMMGMED